MIRYSADGWQISKILDGNAYGECRTMDGGSVAKKCLAL